MLRFLYTHQRLHRFPFLFTILMLISGAAFSQLSVSGSMTPQQLVQNVLVGGGATVSNITFSGSSLSIGNFSGGTTTNLGMSSGVLLCTGNITNAIGPNNATGKGTNVGIGSDPQLASLIPGYNIYDAAVLEFDFVPLSDTIEFRYIFASEEYPEYVNSNFNDVFGFFISGVNPAGGNYVNQNIAIIPGTTLPVSIDNVNNGTTNSGPCTNCTYYVNNNNGTTIQYDGFTTVLTSWAVVTPCLTYHIKIAIGDAGDHIYDSGVFLEANSFRSGEDVVQTSALIGASAPNAVEGCNDAIVNFTLPNPTGVPRTVHYVVGGTATNGVDYPMIPDSVVFPAGSDSVSIIISPQNDNIVEGSEIVQLLVQTSVCTYDTVEVTIYDYDTVQVNIPAVLNSCPMATSNLQAVASLGFPPYQYQWSTTDTVANIQVNPNATTTYSVVVNDGCGYADSTDVTVNVFTPPTVTINPDSQYICPNTSASMTASGASTYSWSPAASLSSTTGATVVASPTTNTNYTVIGTDTNSCSDTAYANISIYPVPVINPINAAVCPGDSILLTANTSVTGASFLWSNGDTNQTTYVQPTTTSNYSVVVTYPNACSQTATTTVQVFNQSNINITLSSPSVCPGDSVFVQASSASTYSWLVNGVANSTTSNSFWMSPTTSSQVIVNATDANACPMSDSITVGVFTPPNVQVSSSSSSVCTGSIAQLSASGATTYAWSPASTLSSNSGAIVFAIPTGTTTYTVVGTDANQCTDTAQIQITLNSLPMVIASADMGICPNDTATLQAGGAQFYAWTPSATLSSSTGSTVSAFPTTTTSYIVTGTDANGCQNKDTVNVTVYPQVNVNLSAAPDSICLGNTTNLNASGANSYAWSPASTLSANSGNMVVASPTTNQSYQVIGFDIHGCSDTAQIAISVVALPNVSVSPNATICAGQSTTLSANGATTYNWTPNGGTSLTTPSITVSPTNTQTYLVVGANGFGCLDSATTTVTVNQLPVLSINAPAAICNGDSATLIASGATTYQWLPAGFGNTITVYPNTNTSYTVIGTDANGCTDSISQNLTVNPLPVLNITPSTYNSCAGSTVSLSASANMPITSYLWNTGATSNNISVNPTTSTNYNVSGINSFGCSDTANVVINVYSLPNVQIAATNNTICFGDTTQLTANGAVTYAWSPTSSLTASTGSSVGAFPTATTSYTVIGTDANNCVDTTTTTINVNALPVLSINAPAAICNGDSATLIASGATTYQWLPAGFGNTITVYPNTNTSYTVIGTDANGCTDSISQNLTVNPLPVLSITPSSYNSCAGSTVSLSASANMPITSYLWNTGATSNNISVNPTTSTNYNVSGINSFGCSDTANVVINVYSLPNVQIAATNNTICFGDTTQLTANGAVTYAWSPASSLTASTGSSVGAFPTTTTSYMVIGTDANNCVDTTTTTINVNALPVLSINAPAAICNGDSATLIASGATTYQWLPAGFGNTITVYPNTNTSYTVIGTDANGCTDSISQNLTVNPLPVLSITPSSNSTCAGGSVNLTAAANMPLSGFNWNTGATGNSIWVNPQTTSTYIVSGSNAYGCIDSANVSITAFALPNVQITPANSPICIGDTALLTASGAANYSWTPSSVLSATSGSTVNAYPTTSTMVTVIGTDTNNCVDTAQTFITVNALPVLSINAPAAICDGDSAQLVASGASTYQWLPAGFGNAITVFPNTNTTYTVIGTDANGCTDSISQSLVVNPLPILSITPSSNTSCSGSSVNLAASSNMAINGFTWSTGASGNSIWVNPLTTTSYSVSGTNSYGCTDTGMVAITVFALPQVQLSSSNSSICIGDTTSLIASGAANYSWTPASFLSSATGSSVGAFPNTSMSFTVIGTDTNNCVDTATSFITVNSLPTLSINAPAAICNGGSAQLIASGANTYQWLPAGNGTTLMVSPNTTTNYTLIGTDTNGCVDSISQNLVVNPLPQIYINASKTSSCAGDSIQLFASANMNINTYNWSNGVNGNSQWVNPMGTSTYSVSGLNSFGCADTALISINVNQYPIISLNTVDTNICFGDSVMLTTTNAVVGLSYQWSTGSTNTSINVSPATSSNYTITAVDSIGCSDTSLVHVEVNALPVVHALANSTHQCANDTATIYVNTQSNASTYSWNNGLSSALFTTVLSTDTTFTVSVTDSLGCQSQDSVTILVNPIPQLTLSPTSAKICLGDTVGLTVSSSVNPVNFLWYNNSTSSTIIVSPPATTLYSVTATDSLGCSATITDTIVVNDLPLFFVNPPKPEICQGNSISLTATSNVAGITYIWNNGFAGSTLNVTPNNSSQYQVTGTDTNGCKSLVTAEVKVNPNPNVVINPANIGICKGDSVLLNANTTNQGSLTYLWNTGDTTSQFYITPLASSNYSVAVTDSNGCTSTDTMNVMVTTVPSCNILAQSPICSADSSIITVAGSLATGAIVNWNFDGGTVVSGAGMGPLAIKWSSGGTYKVVLDISYKGCTSEPDTQIVEVLQTPKVDFSSMSTEGCGSADIQFVNNTPGMQEYHWNFGDIHSNNDTSSAAHPQYHYSYPGTYFVALNVLSQDGCPAQLIKPGLINIHPNPIADFTMNKTKVSYASPMVNFYDRSIDAVSWEWDFDDPMSGQYNYSSDQDAYHEFQDTGIYDVMLIVTSDHNCKDTTMKRLTNEDGPTFFIPNAFTPNGDGTNDTFFPKGTGYDWSTYEMYIYDRWGELVFHTRDINNGWNGRKHNSQGAEIDDVYSYIITIKAPSGKGERFVGKVVLFH